MKMYQRFFIALVLISSPMLPFTDSIFSQTTVCNYYASPTGTGNGLSQSSPFKISNFWPVAKPGATLCLLNGIYTGANSMINPPANLNGTSSQKITVKALNDGGVRINGQSTNTPVILMTTTTTSCWRALTRTQAPQRLCAFDGGGLQHRAAGRAWDANTNGNFHVFNVRYGTGNLLEDTCGFGTEEKFMSFTRLEARSRIAGHGVCGMLMRLMATTGDHRKRLCQLYDSCLFY